MSQPKYFICTLGTSIANGLGDVLWKKQETPGAWDDRDEAFAKALGDHVVAVLKDKATFHSRCAEATVLQKAGVSQDDRVVLLATDTGLARICGEATRRLIVQGFGLDESSVELVRIVGLQVSDAERLRREGLSAFVKTVVSRIDDNRYAYGMFLCPVGGYKGIVPFLTALGMAYHLPVLYTFERIDSLVRLPPLPFSLDRDLYARAKDALLEIGKRCEMPEKEYLVRIKGYTPEERDWFLSFVEPSGKPGFVTSTAFTEVFAPDFECEKAPVSRQALEDLELLSHSEERYGAACKMVIESQDRLRRVQWIHGKTTATDLQILKQGNTNIRVLGYEHGGRFYICRVLDHADYERLLGSKNCPQVANFRNEEFTEWESPPEKLPDSLEDKESPYESAMRQLTQFNQEKQDLKSEHARKLNAVNNEHAAKERDLEQNLANARKGLGKVASKLNVANHEIQDLQQTNETLQQENIALSEENRAQIAKYESAVQEIGSLRRENSSLSDALRQAHAKLDEESKRGFWGRLAHLFG